MFVSLGATRAGIRATIRQHQSRLQMLAVAVVAVAALSGCMDGTVPLVGPDPADPGVKVRGVSYRSTVAPYTSLRPAAPSAWKEQNRGVAPKPSTSK